MKSLLKMKRLPGILAVGLVALAVGAAGAPATASPATASGATASGLNKKQKHKKKKQLKRCNKRHNKKKRNHCKKHVKKKFRKIAKRNKNNHPPKTPKGETTTVGVYDDYFAPTQVNVKVNDSVKWQWQPTTYLLHNVTLTEAPKGVNKREYKSASSAGPSFSFTRRFITPGEYNFVCTFHAGMIFDVNVSK